MKIRFKFKRKFCSKEFTFFLALLLYCIYITIYISIFTVPGSTLFAISTLSLFMITIFQTYYSKKEFIILTLLILVGIACYVKTRDMLFFRIFLMCFAAKEIDKEKLINFLLKCYIAMFIIVPFTCIFRGIDSIYSDTIPAVGREQVRRFMFGFDGPNRLGVIWICLMSTLLIKRGKACCIKDDLLLGLISMVLYYLTRSRSMIIVCVMILLMPYAICFFKKFKVFILNKGTIPFILFFFIGITYLFAKSGIERENLFNVILNNRLVHFQDVVSAEKLTLFGASRFGEYVGLDNSYFLNFYKRGIICSLIYIIVVIRLSIIVTKKKDLIQFSIISGYIVLSFTQDVIQHPFINFIYFLIMLNYIKFAGLKSNLLQERKLYNDTKSDTLLLVRKQIAG